MEEFITAIIVTGLFYAVLRFFKLSWLKQGFPPTFIYIAGVFAWCTALALVATVFSLVSAVFDSINSPDSSDLIVYGIVLLVLGVAIKLLNDRKDILDIANMKPFLRAAILFRSYDAKRQELFERHEKMLLAEAKKSAAERAATGGPAEDVIDISEDGSHKGDDAVTGEQSPHSATELDLLKRGEGVDLTDLFKSNTSKLPAHPFYPFISQLRIDPSDKVMNFRIVFPSSSTEPELTPQKLERLKQGLYQVFQALLVEQWLKPYLSFFFSLNASCLRVHKDEFDMTRETVFMSVRINATQVLQSRGKQFTSAEFSRIATITMTD
ncbi:MAG TPA: hypothetical protein VI758_02285 [Bacteroidota bacterium]